MIKRICEYCGKTFYRCSSQVRLCPCRFCSKYCSGKATGNKRKYLRGKLHHNWKGGITQNTKCVDCGKKVNWGIKRCHKCWFKFNKKENHPNWQGGITQENNRKRAKLWRQRNKELVRLYCKRRRALQKNGGDLTIQTIQRVYEDNIKEYGTLTCYLCWKPIQFGKDTLEHKIPLSRGGTNVYENLAIADMKCNITKNAKTLIEFRSKKIKELKELN